MVPSSSKSSPIATVIHERPIVSSKAVGGTTQSTARRRAHPPLSRHALWLASRTAAPAADHLTRRARFAGAGEPWHGRRSRRTASKIGVEILRRGGNAIDAAVATGLALAVTLPRAGNLGGGGFMLVYIAKEKKTVVIDYREAAPADTPRDVFLTEAGDAVAARSRDSGLGVGVPGTVAGLSLALRKYGSGKFSLAELAAPAVTLARAGLEVSDDLADSLPLAQTRFKRWPSSARIFLHPDGTALSRGDRLVQTDLASVLEAIGRDGERAFYEGPVAEKIVASVRAAGAG